MAGEPHRILGHDQGADNCAALHQLCGDHGAALQHVGVQQHGHQHYVSC